MSARTAGRLERGQSLVEFALILPIFLIVILGIFDAGRAIYAFNTLSNAARVGARVAIVNQSPTAVRAAVKAEAVGLGLTDADIAFTSCASIGCQLTVTVTHDFTTVTPMIEALFDPELTSTSRMALEREYVGP